MVFNTIELRELIFSKLGVKDALRAGRACKTWQSMLTTLTMQRMLFYQAQPLARLGLKYVKKFADDHGKPQGVLYDVSFTQDFGKLGADGKIPPINTTLHPLLEAHCNKNCYRLVQITTSLQELFALGKRLGKSSDAFICQPPVTRVGPELLATRNVVEVKCTVDMVTGIRLHHILNGVRAGVTAFVEEGSKGDDDDADERDPHAVDSHLEKVAKSMRRGTFSWFADLSEVPRLQQVRICIENHIADTSKWVKKAMGLPNNEEA